MFVVPGPFVPYNEGETDVITFALEDYDKKSYNNIRVLGDIYMHYNEPNQGINLEGMMPTYEYSLNTILILSLDKIVSSIIVLST